MTRVFVVRHAQSAANLGSILSSNGPGSPLTPLGHDQAGRAAASLSEQDITHVTTSPLLRARQTARHIADRCDVALESDAYLREFDLGDWEGLPGTDTDVVNHPVFSAWMRGERLGEAFQGGDTAVELRDRLGRVLDRIRHQVGEKSAVLVTHGGVMAIAVPLIARFVGPPRLPTNAEIWMLRHTNQGWRVGGDGSLGPWQPPETVPRG